MYKIMRNTNGALRRFNNKNFPTYAEARQYVRKYIRNKIGIDAYNKLATVSGLPCDSYSRNPPSIAVVGFSIRKVS